MKTYEDLLDCGESDKARAQFCADAVRAFESSDIHREALEGLLYYEKHNVTIEQYEKFMYTITGRKIKDMYSANHKLKTHSFRRMIIQQANYLLGKGIKLEKADARKKLGKDFDKQLIKAAKWAMAEGRAFGFWNADHLEVFGYSCSEKHPGFLPLYSEKDGEVHAGINFRHKKVKDKVLTFYTLYEPEGFTKFKREGSDTPVIDGVRKPYKTKTVKTAAEGVIRQIEDGYNGTLPIIPLYASDTYESELVGLREAIDCYDLIKSGLANNIDDASEIYWIVKNAGGMDDRDLAQFLQRLKTTHMAGVDSEGSEGVEAQTLDIPTDARKAMLEIIRTDLYDDMMLLDRRTMSAAQKTNQELEMAYQPQDDKTNDFEFFVIDFVEKILELAGIESEFAFERNKVVNVKEQTEMILSAQAYLSEECIIEHLPFLTPEEKEAEIKKLADRATETFFSKEEEDEEDEENEDEDGPEESDPEEK